MSSTIIVNKNVIWPYYRIYKRAINSNINYKTSSDFIPYLKLLSILKKFLNC